MKRILALALLAALSVSLYAQSSDCTPPPMRADVFPGDYQKHIDKMLNGTGEIDGFAKDMLDDFDKECNLRKGLIKYQFPDGKVVYMEPNSLSSSLEGQRKDGSSPKDYYQEGEPKSSRTREVRSWLNSKNFIVVTEPRPDGVNYLSSMLESNMSEDGKQADTTIAGLGSISIWYTPMPIKVKEPEKVAEVYEGGKGAVKFKVTDYLERYCLEGYSFKVSVGNPETLSAPQEVTTGSDGTAFLVLKGNKEGKTKVTVNFDLEDPASGSSLHYSYEMEIEVLPAEKWSYNLEVLDQMLQPFDYYYLSGTFNVVQDIDENNLPVWTIKDCSDAVKVRIDHMDGGTITLFSSQERGNRTAAENENNRNEGIGTSGGPYPVEASFMNPNDRSQGVVIGFNMQKVMQDTKAAEKQMKATEKRLKKDLRKMVIFSLTGRHQSFDFIGSSDPVYCVMAPLNEGSKEFKWGNETLLKLAGFEMPDMSAMQEGGAPQEPPMPEMSQGEYEQKMKEGMEQFFKEGNVVVIPNFYKVLFLNTGNLMLTWEVAMAKAGLGLTSAEEAVDQMMGVQGTITFTREKDN